jgi:hypothetical protein
MVKETVRVEVEGQLFTAEVEVNVDKLDPCDMPLRISGVFTKLPSGSPVDSAVANLLLHSDRTGDGSSHVIRFFGKHGYRFTMTSGSALDFTAEHQSVNPATGMPGFKRSPA